jgi:photosystem II oxygen-evolving enhancer protein 2
MVLKRIAAMLLVILSLSLQGCVSAVGGVSGVKSYVDSIDGYQFLYPNGWLQVRVDNGPDVVFHDLIEQTENVSVVISPVSGQKSLTDLGSPSEVGYQLGKKAIAPPGSGRQADLISAEARELGDKVYYLLEYAVKIGDQVRHNLASAVISRGKLYTFNASTPESRWSKTETLLKQVVNSFSVY